MWLTDAEQQGLLVLARAAITHGLQHSNIIHIDWTQQPAAYHTPRASFVTLQRHGELRGCIGHLEAVQAVGQDVVENAFRAAFRDPRFPPLTTAEYADIHVHISLLTPAEAMQFTSEQDLIAQLQPGEDGLILAYHGHRATFLPSVWEILPQANQFLGHLKLKAGLAADFWSPQLQVWRYRADGISE